MLALPAFEWLLAQRRFTWRAAMVSGVVLLSVLVQLPGVLVNFERQEGLDMQAGASFDQLLWEPRYAPLVTYWTKIGVTPDPLWRQPYVSTLPNWQSVLALAAALATATALTLAAIRLRRNRGAGAWLAAAALGSMFLAGTLVVMAAPDPRWDELSAVREENAALLALITDEAQPQDLVLLDLLPATDKEHRTGLWLNRAPLQPYIGWLRTASMDGLAGERLRQWLSPYRRVWLLLQATDEGDSSSTTERWLEAESFPGRRAWVGSQRYVEYILPPADATARRVSGPFLFAEGEDGLTLGGYTVSQAPQSSDAAVALTWSDAPSPDLRYSLQALDAAGAVVAQVDGVPGLVRGADGWANRIGLALPAGEHTLILKIYRAADGAVLPVQLPGGDEALPYLPLE
jgi:hypothetical protein